jgi:Fe-S cluster assembly iron-binding protein IscA
MVSVTKAGEGELKRILNEHTANPESGLRLTKDQSGNLVLTIDLASGGDEVLEREGLKLLIVEPALFATLEGITIDVDETLEGRRLVITGEPSK